MLLSFQTPYVPSRGYLDSPGRVGWTWPGSVWGGRIPCRPKRVESLHPASVRKSRMLSWAQPKSRQPFFEGTSSLRREGRLEANEQWKGIENSIGDFRHTLCSRSPPRRCNLALQRCTRTLSCTSASREPWPLRAHISLFWNQSMFPSTISAKVQFLLTQHLNSEPADSKDRRRILMSKIRQTC